MSDQPVVVCVDCDLHQYDVVQLKILTAAYLVAPLLDHLWAQWERGEGCCNQCCCACIALNDLLDDGQLDVLYGAYIGICGGDAAGHATWDAEKNEVERTWLTAAWSGPRECHEVEEKVSEA